MGGDIKEGQKRYREFVLSGIFKEIKSPFGEAWATEVLSTESFIKRVRKMCINDWKLDEKGIIP